MTLPPWPSPAPPEKIFPEFFTCRTVASGFPAGTGGGRGRDCQPRDSPTRPPGAPHGVATEWVIFDTRGAPPPGICVALVRREGVVLYSGIYENTGASAATVEVRELSHIMPTFVWDEVAEWGSGTSDARGGGAAGGAPGLGRF